MSHAAVQAQALPIPQPSPLQTVKQNFATAFIEVVYSRPGLKGRKAFGDVVPLGKLWRTGANSATTIEFGDEFSVNGKSLSKGKYGLVTIPKESEWEIIITKDLNVTSEQAFKPENALVRFPVKVEKLNDVVETFTIDFTNIKPTSADVVLKWDQSLVRFQVTAEIDGKIMAAIEKEMKADKRPFHSAANYYYENGKDLKQALEWENKALEANPTAYWMLHLKAKIQHKLGDTAGALETATKSMEEARKAEGDAYVKMNEALIAEIKGGKK
jgi:hypothetical protein